MNGLKLFPFMPKGILSTDEEVNSATASGMYHVFGRNGISVVSNYSIMIGTNGDTRPLMAYNNEPVTVANLAGTGIYEIHYNKYTNELYLVNGGYRPTTAPAPTVETASLRSK